MATRVPSFHGLEPASEQSSRSKRANRKTDTQHELLLRRNLWHMGLRFRKNVVTLPGKPDIVFTGSRLVVFCDGDFWHGRNWEERRSKLEHGTNAAYWVAKIESNIQRDIRNSDLLRRQGWHVMRLWETDVRNNPTSAALKVEEAVRQFAEGTRMKPKAVSCIEVLGCALLIFLLGSADFTWL